MKSKIILLFLLVQTAGFSQQMWRALGDDDFDKASCGAVTLIGRKPLVVKNGSVFFFNVETPDYQSNNTHFSVSKFDGNSWKHFGFPVFSINSPIDGAIDNTGTPYVIYNGVTGNNFPMVKKYQDGSWADVGSTIATSASTIANIVIGSDNLPQILYRESGIIKLKKFNGSDWSLVAETSEFNPFTSLSLELDNNNVPYVVSNYQVGTTYNCFVRKFNGSAWEEVGITGFSGQGRSLVFDTSNTPHMFVGNYIKRFNGTSWEDLPTQLLTGIYPYLNAADDLFFNSSNELYASFLARTQSGSYFVNARKLVGATWQMVFENGFMYNRVSAVSGNDVYGLSYGPINYPNVIKTTAGQTTTLGNTSIFSTGVSGTSSNPYDNEYATHDFSICNGIPLISYKGGGGALVKMFVNDTWSNLGSMQISESEDGVRKTMIRSGTDGQIYLAYNNVLSSDYSDTKLTVKRLTASGWEAVGPVNFSQSAGAQFDFKLSHNNEPYVLYMSGRLQKFDGINWVYVGGSAYTGDLTARFVLDSNDLPYVAFRDVSNSGHIGVKKLNGNVWQYVDQASLSAYTGQQYHPRIAIDAANNIYLGFTDSTLKVHIKRLNNGVWESVGPELFTTGKTDQFELAIDHDNVLYVSYNELTDDFRSRAKVKKFNGTSWEFVGTPDFSPTSVFQAKLDFSSNNTPIACYSYFANASARIGIRYFGESDAWLAVSEPGLANQGQKWTLAPNPASHSFSITGHTDIKEVEIFDLLGKKVLTENRKFQNIDVAALHSGIYIVKIKYDNGTSAVKLIKD